VLRGFSGTFLSGRIAALIGPNGAGKTTLLRIAAGLQRADSGFTRGGGVLYYGGFDLLPVKGSINELRRALGLSPVQKGSRRLSKLSRGELHRVGLDIALALATDVLLLDEPWTALEPDAREALSAELRAHAQYRVIVCSSHDLDEVARLADDVVFLTDGVGVWKRGDASGAPFDRDELIRIYRQSKRTT
jgi:ABC-type multidrug transport system ATPase subunit